MRSTILAVLLLTASACKLAGFEDDDDPPVVGGDIIVADIDPVDIRKDRFEILDGRVVGATLSLTVSYGGGCREHRFQLFTRGAIILSMPPGADVYLVHDGNGDVCRALVQETLVFSLSPLIESSGYTQILLHVWPYELGQPIDPPLLYDACVNCVRTEEISTAS